VGAATLKHWACVGLAVAALSACKQDGGAEGTADESSTGDDPTTSTTAPPTTSTTVDPTDGCIPGNEDCECSSGECVGEMQCVDDVCKPGPQFDPQEQDEPIVLAGLYVPVQIDVNADEYSWSQTGGPPTEILGEGGSIQVPVPPDAQPGEVITLQIQAVRNTIEATFDYHITVLEPVFEDVLGAIEDTAQLGTPGAIDFDGNGNMWVSSSEGFVSRFDSSPSFLNAYDIGAGASGLQIGRIYDPETEDDIPALYVAVTGEQKVVALNLNNQLVEDISTELADGSPLGPVDIALPDDDRDVFMSNGTQILHWFGDGEQAGSTVVLSDALTSPITAMSWGPDANVIYVGTVGKVWRIGVQQDGTANEPELYLDVGDEADPLQAIAGISFDNGANMFVAVPGTQSLHMAPYHGDTSTEIVRSFVAPGAGFDSFRTLRYGNDAFSESALYWTDVENLTVGRLETGLRGR
jgi:hypothetical protein